MLVRIRAWPIGVRVLIAAVFGVLIAVTLIFPVILAVSQYYEDGVDYLLRDGNLIGLMSRGPGLFPLAILAASPLIAFSVVTGWVFRRSIERRPAVWCLAAPLVLWLLVCVTMAATFDGLNLRIGVFVRNLETTILMIPNLLFLFGPMPAAAIFYALTQRRR